MKELVDKISSYNLFNYLLPGILFVVMADSFIGYSFVQEDIVIGVFVYYFVGLVISRFGSLAIEPVLKKATFLKFASYKDFVLASKDDPKINIFSEENNMYRTFCSMFVLLLLLKVYYFVNTKYPVLWGWNLLILYSLLLVMFLYSYRKQTRYIVKRIEMVLIRN